MGWQPAEAQHTVKRGGMTSLAMSARSSRRATSTLQLALFEPLPGGADTLRRGEVEKCVLSSSFDSEPAWIRRKLVLGHEALFLSRTGADTVLERIPLDEMTYVVHGNEAMPTPHRPRPKHHAKASPDDNILQALGDEHSSASVFSIQTREAGFLGGKTIYLRCSTEHECDSWVKALRGDIQFAARRREREEKKKEMKKKRDVVRRLVKSDGMQLLAALVMLGGLSARIAETSLVPKEPENDSMLLAFWIIDLVFISLYGVDLLMNFAAASFLPFFSEWWNVWDVIIISLSVASLCVDALPRFSILRCIRLLRIAHIFEVGTAAPRCLVNTLVEILKCELCIKIT